MSCGKPSYLIASTLERSNLLANLRLEWYISLSSFAITFYCLHSRAGRNQKIDYSKQFWLHLNHLRKTTSAIFRIISPNFLPPRHRFFVNFELENGINEDFNRADSMLVFSILSNLSTCFPHYVKSVWPLFQLCISCQFVDSLCVIHLVKRVYSMLSFIGAAKEILPAKETHGEVVTLCTLF